MFKAENTGMPAWKRILDESGKDVASLDELYNGDWSITHLKSFDWVVDMRFSNPSKAANWLWKNRFDLGEPFSLYPEKEKTSIKGKIVKVIIEDEIVEEEPYEDLFWDYKK